MGAKRKGKGWGAIANDSGQGAGKTQLKTQMKTQMKTKNSNGNLNGQSKRASGVRRPLAIKVIFSLLRKEKILISFLPALLNHDLVAE